jgi:hypothetical protein
MKPTSYKNGLSNQYRNRTESGKISSGANVTATECFDPCNIPVNISSSNYLRNIHVKQIIQLPPLKPVLDQILFKNSVRTAKKTQHFTITKIN